MTSNERDQFKPVRFRMLLAGIIFALPFIFVVIPPGRCNDDAGGPESTEASAKEICHNYPVEKGPPRPSLADQFETVVEVTIEQKSYTMSMEIHYDYPNNDASLTITQNGVVSKWLYNFPMYEGYFIRGSNCQTVDLRQRSGFQLISFTETEHGGHISHVDKLFNFGNSYNETYVVTYQTVRGMPVDQWTSCLESEGMKYRLDYYFTTQNYSNPAGSSPIPVRVLLTRLTKNSQSTEGLHYEHQYDFVVYKPRPCKNVDTYQVPSGVVCHRTQNPKISQPTLPDHFSMGVEAIRPKDHLVSFSDQFFDYSANLTRSDLIPSKNKTSQFSGFGYRPLKVIHDYSTGIQYVIDKAEENCSMRAIPNNSIDAEALRNDPSHVHMRHGADMYRLSSPDLQYQGKRNVREIECDVWSVARNGWFQGVNTTVESCWVPKREIVGSEESIDEEEQVLVQIRLHYKTKSYSSEYVSNVYKYSDAKPDLRVFDIGGCFPSPGDQMQIIFRVQGSLAEVVGHQPHHFQVAIRDAVSKAAKIAPIRVNSFFFGESLEDYVDAWMTIYTTPNIEGNVEHPVPQVSLKEAYGNLEEVINSDAGLTISLVSKEGSKNFLVVKNSLTTDKQVDDPRRPYDSSSQQDGHSSGSMAALGIMMLILGVALGVMGTFFFRKRGTSIPYQVQD